MIGDRPCSVSGATPNVDDKAPITNAGSITGDRSTKKTALEKLGRNNSAAATAKVVFPMPADPTIVTRRLSNTSRNTALMAYDRPITAPARVGKLAFDAKDAVFAPSSLSIFSTGAAKQ